ncbi:MFS transporter [Georgenia faecalis]|uniref:Multidrug efflux pump Tap n=1 Tax=Georgenia faecalis TaxID=2483799 RepID=A0ABV9DAC0_9MICO|nr:MFS transporter [Georgenia faecalis]
MTLIPVAYLSSYLLSMLGNSIAGIALPLIVLGVTGSAMGAGWVAAATAVPAVVAGLVMGVVIDRINRRTSSIVTDAVSAASVAALPLVDLVSGLSLGWFILFGIIGSLGDVPGLTARDALLAAVVRHGGITAERLLGMRESLGAIALLLGPAAAGTLMVLLDGSTVLWLTAATSMAAALLTLLIPHEVGTITPSEEAEATTGASSGWAQLRAGWRALFRSPFLVSTTVLSLVAVVALAGYQGLVLPVHVTLVGRPGLLGFVLSALAGGMLVGGAIYVVVGSRGRRRTWFLATMLGTTVGFAALAALPSGGLLLAGAFVLGLSSGLFGALLGVLMVERIPEQMRGRIMGTQNAMLTAAAPVGIVAAAALTEYVSLDVAAAVLAGAWLVGLGVGVFARALRNLEPASERGTDEETAVVSGA